jgi:cytochrome c peroxidase
MNKKKVLLASTFIVLGAGIALSFPLINLINQAKPLQIEGEKAKDPAFAKFSRQLQTSCADCHTQGLTQYPFYFNLPVAKDIIAKDIEEAQEEFLLDQAKLTGAEPFRDAELAKIKRVLIEGEMPPLKYTALHWNAIVGSEQKKELLAYIDGQNPRNGLVPLTSKTFPQTNPAKVSLGKSLYFDKRLSGDNTVSCASCHSLEKGGSDQEQVSTGIRGQKGPINAPTVFNSTFNFCQFWDGRAKDLQAQAAGPVTNPKEMGSNWPEVVAKLEKDTAFSKSFKTVYSDGLSEKNITDAIAQYEKTLVTPNSTFDRFLQGDKAALNDQEKKGYELFQANNCASCHSGIALGGESFEKMGTKANYFGFRNEQKLGGHSTTEEADFGRFNVTKQPSDKHRFKVPTLRNIALTFPYFHDGATSNLTEAVKIMAKFQVGKDLSDSDAQAITAFLEATTGELRQSAQGRQ